MFLFSVYETEGRTSRTSLLEIVVHLLTRFNLDLVRAMVDLRPMKVSSFSAIVDMVAIDESIVTPTTFGATERTQP